MTTFGKTLIGPVSSICETKCHSVRKKRLRLMKFLFPNRKICVTTSSLIPEKAMAPHSSIVAWKIPWMEEPSGLQSMGSLRVGHD